jgi:hypothetical protein
MLGCFFLKVKMQDLIYLKRLLQSATTSMFAVFRELELPDEIIDKICRAEKNGVEEVVTYLKELNIPSKDKIIRSYVISWAVTTIAICGQCGMVLEKKENDANSDHP